MLPVSLDCHFFLPLRYSLTFICPVSCVPYVASFSGLSIFCIAPSVFSNVYLSCVLCTLCCQFLWIANFLPLRYSLTFICPVSCVPCVASFCGLSFFFAPSVFSNVYLSCVLCTLCCQFLWIVIFFIAPSVFSNVYLSCVLSCVPMLPVSLDCLFCFIALRYSLTFICPVSCVPYVASFSGLSIFVLPFGIR